MDNSTLADEFESNILYIWLSNKGSISF
jgi:hypothetical protein